MRTNVVPIYTNLMIDHLIASAEDRCEVCAVIDAFNCDGLFAPDGRYFWCHDCTCHCYDCGKHDTECACPGGPARFDDAAAAAE